MRRVIIIIIIAAIHLVLALGSYLATFEVSGFFFGVAPRPSRGVFHETLSKIHTVLMFPLGLAARSLSPGVSILGWPLMILNSLLWAVAIYLLLTRWLGIGKRKEG